MNYPASSLSNPGTVTSYGRSKLHPINAEYLCSSQPHRIYADAAGSILELTVMPIAQTVVEAHVSHGGIVGVHYRTPFAEIIRTIILSRQGNLSEINEYGYLDPHHLDDDTLYMLLNPVDINGWFHMPSAEHQQVMEDIGMSIPSFDYRQMSHSLEQAIRRTREQYRFHIKA
jgi:hypothetical protein